MSRAVEPDEVEVLVLMALLAVTGEGSGTAGAGAILAGIFGLIGCLALGSTFETAEAVVTVTGLVCNFKVVLGLVSMETTGVVVDADDRTGVMAMGVAKDI